MIAVNFRPLDHWPGERTRSRLRAKFKVTYARSLDLLESELQKLRAKDIIIQVDGLALQDIRNDGWPRSTWAPGRYALPGVIVSFQSAKGEMSFPCDRFTTWQDNLRAIALSLEALRVVDRYGVTRGNEQYRGWARLEAPGSNGTVKMSRTEAAQFIAKLTGADAAQLLAPHTPNALREAMCKRAMASNHPDHATSPEDAKARHDTFVKIGQAQAVLCGEGGK